jgi:hypothetical protein
MDKKQNIKQPPDTGKLTNFHYASEEDKRTDRIEQEVNEHQNK